VEEKRKEGEGESEGVGQLIFIHKIERRPKQQ
jgi:hypothetical protein